VQAFLDTFGQQVEEVRLEQKRLPYRRIRLLAVDESRCGLFPLHRHRITLKGIQPIASIIYQFEFLYLYGAVEPTTGAAFLLELPAMNALCFQVFLDELAATDPESLLLLLLDNGRLHTARSLRIPDNVRLMSLPPYAPELNPIERLWRVVKDRLAQALPQTLEHLSSCLTSILHQLTSDDIRSLTSYHYFIQAANG